MKNYKISLNNTSVTFIPDRGGLISSLKLIGEEILFMNMDTLNNLSCNVRGGIPVLFPNAGPIKDNNVYKLLQHGFARKKVWKYKNINKNSFGMYLESDEETKKIYNFDFSLEIITEILSDNKVKITQKITNIGDLELPISPGLHPYFFIKNEEKKMLKIYLSDVLFDHDYSWMKGDTIRLKNYQKIKLSFPNGKIIVLEYDKSYERLWIRSEYGKDFICVEPISREENSLIDNPIIVKPGESKEFIVSISTG